MKVAFYSYQACILICFEKLGWETLSSQKKKKIVFFFLAHRQIQEVSHSYQLHEQSKQIEGKRWGGEGGGGEREGGRKGREEEKERKGETMNFLGHCTTQF